MHLSTLRDLALIAGAGALAALAAEEIGPIAGTRRTSLAPTPHGWLYKATDWRAGDASRIRPATAPEAAAAAASRDAGNGGWFGLTPASVIVPVDDDRWPLAGRSHGADRIDPVFVTGLSDAGHIAADFGPTRPEHLNNGQDQNDTALLADVADLTAEDLNIGGGEPVFVTDPDDVAILNDLAELTVTECPCGHEALAHSDGGCRTADNGTRCPCNETRDDVLNLL